MILENGLSLAYIGDAYFELKVREYLLENNHTLVNDLHNNAISYTSAKAQAEIAHFLMDKLSSEEMEYFKRGRNAKDTHKPKNASLGTHRISTGFEALIGYLYLIKNEERLNEIIDLSIDFINNKKSLEIGK